MNKDYTKFFAGFVVYTICLLLAGRAQAATLNVCKSGCTYITIQSAIDAANPGDTVLVGDGVYTENISFNKNITVQSIEGATYTIIDGDASGSVVTFASGIGATSVLDGFALQNGSGTSGGGIFCSSSASPTIINCIIRNNTVTNFGGGIFSNSPSTSPTIINCTISDNEAGQDGGGIVCSSSPIIVNCIISRNKAGEFGGGIKLGKHLDTPSLPTIVNCTISDNEADISGGGIFSYDSSLKVVNSIIWSNSPNEILVDSTTSEVTYSDIKGGYTGTGNIDADPLFVGHGNYHLTVNSPCIDRGTDNTVTYPNLRIDDVDGNVRPYDVLNKANNPSAYDMGADEVGIIYVDDNYPTPINPCMARTGVINDPYCIIQDAIDVASSGDTVLVDDGIYDYGFVLSGKAIIVQSVNGAASTILDGKRSGSVVTIRKQVNVQLSTTFTGSVLDGFSIINGLSSVGGGGIYCIDTTPIIRNCIIRNNESRQATDQGTDSGGGGGIYVSSRGYYESKISTIIENCIIRDNLAGGLYGYGGGILTSLDSNLSLINCTINSNDASADTVSKGGGIYSHGRNALAIIDSTINSNSAYRGAGIYLNANYGRQHTVSNSSISGNRGSGIWADSVKALFTNCTISSNLGFSDGGGIFDFASSLTYERCTISDNWTLKRGGGIWIQSSPEGYPDIRNCLINGNQVYGQGPLAYGGGIGYYNSSPTIVNCTMTGNWARKIGGAIYGDGGSAIVANSILWGNTALDSNNEVYVDPRGSIVVTYSDIQGGFVGTGNIDANPLFAGGSNYHLQAGSPCIDTGVYTGTVVDDIDEDPRPWDGSGDGTAIYDMGYDEYVSSICTDADGDLYYFEPGCGTIKDCDDNDNAVYPGASEICDGKDSDCDGTTPANEIDSDGDGQGICAGDCDNTDSSIYSGAPELCDGKDNDCDGTTPANEADGDGDGQRICAGDCDDTDTSIYSGAPELCDGKDNDCDGTTPANEADSDGDGQRICAGDCDDTDTSIYSGALEVCDGKDNDCDGTTPANEADGDGDGQRICAGDCDDTDTSIYSGAIEICDGKDNNCDRQVDEDCSACVIYVPLDYTTIQSAINAAYDGCLIQVDDGVYTENISIYGKAITIRSKNGPTKTTIDGDNSGTVVTFSSYHFSVLDGFTIQNGSSLTGGGISCGFSFPTITNCIIRNNHADYGGGIWCGSAEPTITNCTIVSNTAIFGGGIYLDDDTFLAIANCTISENTASNGGGIYTGGYDLFNFATLTNSVLWGNTPNEIESYAPDLVDTTYSNVQGGYPGIGNRAENPLFVGGGDYHLTGGSPCIDAGTINGAPEYDFEGDPRLASVDGDDMPDMGADEYVGDVSCPHDGDVNQDGNVTPADALLAFQHYLGLTILDECQQAQADVNNDGTITPADALCIFQKYLGLPSCLD